jgi:hypothetical protein
LKKKFLLKTLFSFEFYTFHTIFYNIKNKEQIKTFLIPEKNEKNFFNKSECYS